jgi:hypothetical protein
MLKDSLNKQEILASSTAAKLKHQESENIALKKVCTDNSNKIPPLHKDGQTSKKYMFKKC